MQCFSLGQLGYVTRAHLKYKDRRCFRYGDSHDDIFTLRRTPGRHCRDYYPGTLSCLLCNCSSFNSSGQNGRCFADDIFICVLLNENVWIPLKISLKFLPKVWINNITALVQIMAQCWLGNKPLSVSMMVSLLMHIYASLGLNALKIV